MADPEPSKRPSALASQLDELDTHLDLLLTHDDPSQHFSTDLFDRISFQLGPVAYPDLTERFLPRLGVILKRAAALAEAAAPSFQGCPPPLLTLTIKLLRPLSFTAALELCPPPYLVTALAASEEHINALALAILAKAAAAPSDASILATTPRLLEGLLERWLLSPSVAVGQQAVLLLGDLLDADCPRPPPPPAFTAAQRAALDLRRPARPPRARGHGAVWRRLFGAAGGLAWALLQRVDAALLPASSPDPAVRRQRSLAQDRLLRLLPRLAALDFPALAACTAPRNGRAVSLLEFATLHMVDRAGDELLRLTWTDYVMKLVGALRVADPARLSVEELRRLVCDARDPGLVEALWSMPGNVLWTPQGEEHAMREWLRLVAPRPAPRIASALP